MELQVQLPVPAHRRHPQVQLKESTPGQRELEETAWGEAGKAAFPVQAEENVQRRCDCFPQLL